jgi:hypothetical protein
MPGELAEVEVLTQGDDSIFWNVVYINGIEMRPRFEVESIQQGNENCDPLKRIAAEAFRLGYRQGFANSQRVIREAIGVK